MKDDSLVIHGLKAKDNPHKAIVPPIFLASTYIQPTIQEFQKFAYARGGNPTRSQVEKLLATLEKADFCYAFSSGMAAISTVFNLLKQGDSIILNSNVYGGTFRYLDELFENRGLHFNLVEDINQLTQEDFDKSVKMIFIETPSNPLLRVTDIQQISQLAHQNDALVVVDNTFLTAYLQKPLHFGADLVVYSATKYLSGHADLLAGAILTNSKTLAAKLQLLQNTLGNILSPYDSYGLIKGIKTLSVRLDRQIQNTCKIINYLEQKEIIVNYPGSFSEKEKQTQEKQATAIGAVLSFDLPEIYDLETFIATLEFFPLAVSLGGVESLVCIPKTMTHESYPDSLQNDIGINERLVRLAIGIENSDDLIQDLDHAFTQSLSTKGEIV